MQRKKDTVSCKACKDAHKQCDGERPCGRCRNGEKTCQDPPPAKRGRPPKKKGKDDEVTTSPSALPTITAVPVAAPAEDLRALHHCRELIMRHPQIIFADPELAARAFGVELAAEFFVCELPPRFEASMSLAEYEQLSQIKFMSGAMCNFLRVEVGECVSQAAIRWLNQVCSPECVRACMTTPMEDNCVRRWMHKKLYQTHALLECNVRGFLLPRVRVMFVDVASHVELADESQFEATRFVWTDLGAIDAMAGGWGDDWANVFLAQIQLS